MTAPPPDLPSVDSGVIAQLREVMEDEFQDLLQTYLGNVPRELQRLREALAAGSVEGVVASSHALKGSSANLGVLRLAHLLRELELLGRTGELGEPARQGFCAIEDEFAVVRPLLEQALAE